MASGTRAAKETTRANACGRTTSSAAMAAGGYFSPAISFSRRSSTATTKAGRRTTTATTSTFSEGTARRKSRRASQEKAAEPTTVAETKTAISSTTPRAAIKPRSASISRWFRSYAAAMAFLKGEKSSAATASRPQRTSPAKMGFLATATAFQIKTIKPVSAAERAEESVVRAVCPPG